jgi:ABC-type antimicrobial peptide transport system ATPase subunit
MSPGETAETRAIEMMKKVGIRDAEARARSYPSRIFRWYATKGDDSQWLW